MHSSPWRKYKMSHIFKKRCDLCTLEENGLRTPLEAFATHPFPESLTFQIGLTLLIPPVFQSKQVPFWISFHILSFFFFFLNYYCKYYFVLFTIFFIARNKLPSQVISSCWHFMSTSEVSFLATCLHGLSQVLVVLGQHCECPTHPPALDSNFPFMHSSQELLQECFCHLSTLFKGNLRGTIMCMERGWSLLVVVV